MKKATIILILLTIFTTHIYSNVKSDLCNISWIGNNSEGKFEKLFQFDDNGTFIIMEMYPDGNSFYKLIQGNWQFENNNTTNIVLQPFSKVTYNRTSTYMEEITDISLLPKITLNLKFALDKFVINNSLVLSKAKENTFVGVWKEKMKSRMSEFLYMEEKGTFLQLSFDTKGNFKMIRFGNWQLDEKNKIVFDLDFKGMKLADNQWRSFDRDLLTEENKTLMVAFDTSYSQLLLNSKKLNR